MASLPVEVLIGISYGLLVGTVVASGLGIAGFLLRYYAETPLPQIAVIAIALPAAGLVGYAMGILETGGEEALRLTISTVVIVLLALYASSQGDRVASELPRENAQPTERKRTLSIDAIDSVDAVGQVTIRATGGVRDIDGYPPLPPELERTLADESWRLPVDLPLSELEARLEDLLRTEYDLEAVSVSVDGRGRASIRAAPPSKGVAKNVPEGWRAVSVAALVPGGLSPGDRVRVEVPSTSVEGTVVSATVPRTDPAREGAIRDCDQDRGRGRDRDREIGRDRSTGTDWRSLGATSGGDGRVTVAVPTPEAGALLDAERARVVVVPDGSSQAFETFSLLERAGKTVRKVELGEETGIDVDDDRVRLFAVRRSGADDSRRRWTFEPAEPDLEPGDEAFVIGDETAMKRFDREARSDESNETGDDGAETAVVR